MSIVRIREGTGDWPRRKRLLLSGSEAGAVIGLKPEESPLALYYKKIGAIAPDYTPCPTAVRSGLEALAAELFTRRTGKQTRRVGGDYLNSEYRWAYARPDRRVVGENAFLEVACTQTPPEILHTESGGEAPVNLYPRMLHDLAVTGAERIYLALLVEDRRLAVYSITPEEEEQEELMAAEQAFWQRLQNRQPPPADGSPCTTEALRRLYPESSDTVADLSDLTGTVERYYRLTEQLQALEQEKRDCGNRIQARLGSCGGGVCGEYTLRFVSRCRIELNVPKYEADHPGIGPGYYRVRFVRPLQVFRGREGQSPGAGAPSSV